MPSHFTLILIVYSLGTKAHNWEKQRAVKCSEIKLLSLLEGSVGESHPVASVSFLLRGYTLPQRPFLWHPTDLKAESDLELFPHLSPSEKRIKDLTFGIPELLSRG